MSGFSPGGGVRRPFALAKKFFTSATEKASKVGNDGSPSPSKTLRMLLLFALPPTDVLVAGDPATSPTSSYSPVSMKTAPPPYSPAAMAARRAFSSFDTFIPGGRTGKCRTMSRPMSCRAGKREDKGEPLRGGEPGAAVGAVEVPLEGLEGLDPPSLGEAKGKEGSSWVGEGVLRGERRPPIGSCDGEVGGEEGGGEERGGRRGASAGGLDCTRGAGSVLAAEPAELLLGLVDSLAGWLAGLLALSLARGLETTKTLVGDRGLGGRSRAPLSFPARVPAPVSSSS